MNAFFSQTREAGAGESTISRELMGIFNDALRQGAVLPQAALRIACLFLQEKKENGIIFAFQPPVIEETGEGCFTITLDFSPCAKQGEVEITTKWG